MIFFIFLFDSIKGADISGLDTPDRGKSAGGFAGSARGLGDDGCGSGERAVAFGKN
jgi:hypothetical protein